MFSCALAYVCLVEQCVMRHFFAHAHKHIHTQCRLTFPPNLLFFLLLVKEEVRYRGLPLSPHFRNSRFRGMFNLNTLKQPVFEKELGYIYESILFARGWEDLFIFIFLK